MKKKNRIIKSKQEKLLKILRKYNSEIDEICRNWEERKFGQKI